MPSPSTIPSSSTNTSTSQEGYVALEDDPGSAGNNEPFEDSEEHTKVIDSFLATYMDLFCSLPIEVPGGLPWVETTRN